MDFRADSTMMFSFIEIPPTEFHIEFVDVFSWNNVLANILLKVAQSPHKTKLAIMCPGDGLISEFDKLSNIVNELEKQTTLLRKDMLLVIGSMCVASTFDKYKECIKERAWPLLTLVIQNAWENSAASYMTSESHTMFDSSPRVKNKLLLFFNGEARPDRGFMLASLIEHDLLKRSYVSAYHSVDIYFNLWLTNGGDPHAVSGVTPEIINVLSKNAQLFPMELSRVNYYSETSNSFHPKDDYNFFNDSYFSLVHETIYYNTSFIGSGHIPTLFLTEKTYKVIAAKHPFIIAQRPNILAALRAEGYKTFAPYIDESYDLIEDDVTRLHAIKNEVLRLSKYSDDDWIKFQQNVKSIVEHNFELLLSRNAITYRILNV